PTTTTATATATATQVPSGPMVPVLVSFKASTSATDQANAVTGVKGFGATTARSHDQIHTIELHVPSSAVAQVVNAMSHHPSVAHAAPAIKLSKASTPNDSDYAQQWALPKISWDQAYGVVSIPGSAKIA